MTAVYLNWDTILGGVSDLLLLTRDKRNIKDRTMRERTNKFLVAIEVIAGIWTTMTRRGTEVVIRSDVALGKEKLDPACCACWQLFKCQMWSQICFVDWPTYRNVTG